MSKETAVEFLIQQIELALKLNKVQINFEYRIKTINPVYEIARKLEREQIIGARMNSMTDDELSREVAEQYYNETYKGGEQ